MNNITREEMNNIIRGDFSGECIHTCGVTHYHYLDCNEADLVYVQNKEIRVHKKCLEAFNKMAESALLEGIILEIVSGYRSSKYQIEVFKHKFKDKNNPTSQEFEQRVKVSAPAGFSEHHTGLAIDINSVEDDFAFTKEALWLEKNAPKFGFELSFPKNNKQGLCYEPWHWRYVGDDECKIIFVEAKKKDDI